MKRKFHLAVGYYIPRAIGKYIIHNRKLDRYINGSRALKFLCNAIDRLIIRNDRNRIFDEDYYFKKYGNIIPPGTDLLTHFIRAGHRQGCNPCALFDVEYYRRQAGIGKDFPLNVLSQLPGSITASTVAKTATSPSRRLIPMSIFCISAAARTVAVRPGSTPNAT